MHRHHFTTKNMQYTKPPEVDRAWPVVHLHNVTEAVFGSPGIFK